MNHIKIIQPSDAYLDFLCRIPQSLKSKKLELVVVHYNSSYKCDRWTERARDLKSKHGKRIQYDICVGYLVKPEYLNRFFEPEVPSFTTVLAHRLYKDTWVESVDVLDFATISYVEHYGDVLKVD